VNVPGQGRHLAIGPALVAAALAACVALGASAAGAEAKTLFRTVVKSLCTDTSTPIPDGPEGGDFASAAVSTGRRCPKRLICGYGGLPLGARVLDVDARVRVTHPSLGDLNVLLVSPVGTLVPLTATGNGGGGDDFGSGSSGCRGTFTTFDDSAPLGIRGAAAGLAPFAGSYRPQQPLAANIGTFGAGDWRFYFDDVVAGNAGAVEAVGLKLSYRYRAVKKRKRSARPR
jgi:hypothetical protein